MSPDRFAERSAAGGARWGSLILSLLIAVSNGMGASAALAPQLRDFEERILPLLNSYCLDCHSTKRQKGDLDLERFDTVESVVENPSVWEKVVEQLSLDEMPPEEEPQPTAEEQDELQVWVTSALDEAARRNAGDPGPVMLRRLNNAEYTWTVRDLTGVHSLDPAGEFPGDSASGEGFMNVGHSLVMSPSLLTKYLDAAKDIAKHAVLLPHGIAFSSSTSRHDWTEEKLVAIRDFYSRYTTTGKSRPTVLAGLKLDSGTGSGLLPLARYLDAVQDRGDTNGLSGKYLRILGHALEGGEPSIFLDSLRKKYRAKKLTVSDVEAWQRVLWRFAKVGHIGKVDGPTAWQEPVSPLVREHEVRTELAGNGDVTLYLSTSDAGDGTNGDHVVWENPRLIASGRPDIPVDDLTALIAHLEEHRARIIDGTEECLNAIAEGGSVKDAEVMGAWQEYLGFGNTHLDSLLSKEIDGIQDYDFVQGWTSGNDLSVIANSSTNTVRIPGIMKGNSVAMHPSPKRTTVIAWRSPISGNLSIQGDVAAAHPECGNGVTWALEVRRGLTTEILASGVGPGAVPDTFGPFENVPIESGQVVAFIVGPRDGNHACDLTAVNLSLTTGQMTWDLARDVSPNILEGNPHGPWHFLSESAGRDVMSDAPAVIVDWREGPSPEQSAKVRQYLENEFPLNSPLLARAMRSFRSGTGGGVLRTCAPSTIEIQIPADLADGSEFVVTAKLASQTAGSVQARVTTEKPDATVEGQWFGDSIIVNDGSVERERIESALEELRALFPIALCYARIVPVDEGVTLKLFHREDDHLNRLLLDENEAAALDRLWDELMFVSQAPLKQVDAFEQLWQYATQDADPSAFEPLRNPIQRYATTFRERQEKTRPVHVDAVLEFAGLAYRRPLSASEENELRDLYRRLREQEMSHEAAVRLTIARTLVSPAFLYRLEAVPVGVRQGPVSEWELATRLSYFLWSSAPDSELLAVAARGELTDPDVLATQARRMLRDPRVRRLATEFGCAWLHIYDFDELDEKSPRHFPMFADVRGAMYEEAVQYFTDLFLNDASVTTIFDADHTFLNESLSSHYGIPGVTGPEWRRVDGVRKHGRGGVLGMGATLSKHAGASRTSPILRGNWVAEVLLGDKLPRPPAGVPPLPEDEAVETLTVRQLTEKHSSDPKCYGCHMRIDGYGFAMEAYDAIGRFRTEDLGGRPIITRTTVFDGTEIEDALELRDYLLGEKRRHVIRQFNRKLLGYALGRGVVLSDRPLIEEMAKRLETNDYRISSAIETIVRSQQFREIRGREMMVNAE